MQRPVMDPTFVPDPMPAKPRPKWASLLRPAKRLGRKFLKVLFYNPLSNGDRKPASPLARPTSPFNRFCRALLYRLAFAPPLLALAIAALVYTGTHPRQAPSDLDPSSEGIYYDPVTFLSDDGVRLEGWLVPVLEPNAVVSKKDAALRQKNPAVVLVHDFTSRRQQMLPLVRPLHDAGLVVLVVSLRGSGNSGATGVTFGLRESLDVKAAVQMLRNRVYVDPKRIAVVGVGTGGSAALLAAGDDPRIAALVLDHPSIGAQQVVTDFIGPRAACLKWMRPMCKWAFEISYQVDVDDLEWTRLVKIVRSRPILMLDSTAPAASFTSSTKVSGIRDFLRTSLRAGASQSASAR